ncbi:helix-hairpin-helix domain-containing protein [Floricoccus penangensis]|uniref:helix-hairpin-helix domain-containing protein n=1 Tax=Floricoccus penangensis TaxID=1859475 RepID=UPI0020421ED0|nr:helix-hairpin-helix domain-containing protein [Floricoccus penangensis]URZ87960.1 helix-hairpin-helix domain-containing protein [Floricoccus penangensis]
MNFQVEIIEKIKNHKKNIAVLVCLLMIIGIFSFSIVNRGEKKTEAQSFSKLLSDQKENNIDIHTEKNKNSTTIIEKQENLSIVVDVKGAVNTPGTYKVSSNLRVNDVVKLAGGMTKDADNKSVNLAQKITDEMVIYVASIGENINIIDEPTKSTKSNGSIDESSNKININTADVNQLQTLSGVGAKKAQDIIDYREQNGDFKKIEELQNVSGFGAKSIEKLKENLTVD